MDELFQILILQEIERIWKSLKADMQPNGVWIAQHRSVPVGFDNIIHPDAPERVYFLDKTGISEENAKKCLKLTKFPESPMIYKNKFVFENGLAMFAKYENGEDCFYFCYEFGGRFGKSYKVKFNEAGDFVKYENLWISWNRTKITKNL